MKRYRGERMRKLLIVLLAVGLFLGTFTVIESVDEDIDGDESALFDEGDFGLATGDPSPCGGEGGGTGGGGIPG